METLYCHSASASFESPLTGNALTLNTSLDKHLLPAPSQFSADKARSVAKAFLALAHKREAPFTKPTTRDMKLLTRLSTVDSLASYAEAIDAITSDFDPESPGFPRMERAFVAEPGKPRPGVKPKDSPRRAEGAFSKMSAVLLRLWSAGQLAIAPKWGRDTRQFCEINEASAGSQITLLQSIESSFSLLKDEQDQRRVVGLLYRFCSNTLGIESIDDIVPGAIQKEAIGAMGNRLSMLLKLIRENQLLRHDQDKVPQTPKWHGNWGKRTRGDNQLGWVDQHPDLSLWKECFLGWLPTREAQGPALMGAEFFLRYLIKNPAVSRDPAEFLSRAYISPKPVSAWLAETYGAQRAMFDVNNLCHDFFAWILIERLSAEDDEGRPMASPVHWNPLARMSKKAQRVQTHREAIPTRLIRKMIAILCENDFAWPKSVAGDQVPYLDPATGQWTQIWSPIRATAMLLKLLLPLRTFQVCMLESGELDAEIYRDGEWIPNPSPLAQKGRRMGALRKFTDRTTGRVSAGFYINTNKTADNGRLSEDRGYEIPWEHELAVKSLASLMRWQERFNPLTKPQRWADIHDSHIQRTHSRDELVKRGEAAFLFRDPAGGFKNDPLSTARLGAFWTLLLRELERRLAAAGETMPDGSPIALVHQPGLAKGALGYEALYDLHSLRVSLITALATEGGVPIPILSKCIAGHASILMTLYYVKLGAPMINEELARAQKSIDENEQESFKRFIFEKDAKAFRPFVASNNEAGMAALEGKQTHLWSINDKGICPVGGSLCHIGGPKTTNNTSVGDYAPVPGGPRNCVRCRFFVTGPAFLGGLVAHFNAVGVELMEAAERNRQKEAAIQKMEDELFEAGGNDARLLERVKIAQERQEAEMREVDAIASNWHAVYAFIERSKAILANQQGQARQLAPQSPLEGSIEGSAPTNPSGASKSPAKLSLVLGGDEHDFSVMMEEGTAFEAFNAVCQMSVAYPAEKSVPLASLRRSKLLDAMLARNQCPPVFAALSDEEAIAVGNQLSSLLLAKLGRAETANLIEGRRMLESCGIEQDVRRLVSQHAPMGFLPLIKEPGSSTPQLPQPPAKRAKRIHPPKERP